MNYQSESSTPSNTGGVTPTSTSISATAAEREVHLLHLKDQLTRLQYNLNEFNALFNDTTTHFKAMQNLAVMHGSLFMASNTVFGNDNFANSNE